MRTALPGQTLTVRARVTGGKPSSVTLFVATSRDAAPFKVAMTVSGTEMYAGSIPEASLTPQGEIMYYVEARDATGAAVETPWYTIRIGAARVEAKAPESSWKKPALIGGGILAAGGAAYALSSGGGGGGGSDTPADTTSIYKGTYIGADTTCVQAPDGVSKCASSDLTITVSDKGVLETGNLYAGESLQTTLSGPSFILVKDIDQDGRKGQVQYLGTIVDQRIVGSVQGSVTSTNGISIYTGTFSALK